MTLGFEPDARHYQDAAKILSMKGLKEIRLLTNNLHKVKELNAFGITILDRVPLEMEVLPENRDYLRAKRERFNHQIGNV